MSVELGAWLATLAAAGAMSADAWLAIGALVIPSVAALFVGMRAGTGSTP